MREIGRYRRRKQKKIIVMGSLSILLFLCAGYAAFSTKLSISATGNIKEKSRVIQSWTGTDQTDFHSDFYKQNIVSATFLDNNKVPSNAAESWNVSEDKENGGVIAWVVPNSSDNTKYDLYIGANGGVIANEDSSFLFYNFQNVREINFNNNFDTKITINMASMFQDCISLLSLNLSNFDTSNVIDMQKMFRGCQSIIELNLSHFITNKVIDMSDMFFKCYNLQSIDLSSFDTSNVKNMWGMFNKCNKLQNLDLHNFNTNNVWGMSYMFDSCFNLKSLNLCSFNTSNVTSMISMFGNSSNLKTVYVSFGWKTTNADTTNMFTGSGLSSVTTGQC